MTPHLFVDISAHGFGHLSQVAPVLNRLVELRPQLRLSLRSALPGERLRQRIRADFAHLAEASDFGYVMRDAVTLDLPATAAAYRAAHAHFAEHIAAEANRLDRLAVTAVFSDIAYLPLAGAAAAGLPALAMCSLNWADLFAHYFGQQPWAAPIHAEMLAAYRSARFLRVTPGMPMNDLHDDLAIGPIGAHGCDRRRSLCEKIGAGTTATLIVVAMGGVPLRLPVEHWPYRADRHYLLPAAWHIRRPDCHPIEALDWPFVDLLRSVDVVVTKPGYGTFAEAAGNATAVIYQRRDDWPEQTWLIDWLHRHARCAEIEATALAAGNFDHVLATLAAAAVPPAPTFSGIDAAAGQLNILLDTAAA